MKCHVCGSEMKSVITSLPFKVRENTIVIMKELPTFQCEICSEYLLDDSVMQRVEGILDKVDTSAELEVIRYAA
jgi:YgiT-type zinc finger domain-containing protein